MKKLIIVSTFILAIFIYIGTAFAADEVSYIVRFKPNVDAQKTMMSRSLSGMKLEVLVPSMNLYKVTVAKSRVNALSLLRSNDAVKYAQEDHPVKLREVVPNDPDFSRQWNLKNIMGGADIKATEAWSLGTKGTNLDGRDVVVAVVDGTVELSHGDLKENIWVNTAEIPGNGIDDDGNGYIDDINGWNARTDSGNLGAANYHGTHVAGIISAKSDNGIQVAGVNWNVKVMSINGASGTTSVVAKAYGYALAQKKLFIETNGEKGANVVATNSSFGVDRANCTNGDFPVWNDLYEEMGKAGIISAAATANAAWDIDVIGDVPTGCSSEYIFSVTNTTQEDKINRSAGWGLTTIDIGAPGTNILSTYTNNSVGLLTGTSMATPHIAGAIAFLHTVASPQLMDLVRSNPAEGGLTMKKILMETADPVSDLQGRTVSGGRLNLAAAAKKAYSYGGTEGGGKDDEEKNDDGAEDIEMKVSKK